MVFKRRDKRSWSRAVAETLWPRGGWRRAFSYIQHRVRRLPDDPKRISRGIFAGVIVTFTPFYGLHFLIAYFVAKLMRGNVIAALLATFVGNPLTFPFIAALALNMGHWMLGTDRAVRAGKRLPEKFGGAVNDLWLNFKAIFTPERAEWARLIEFNEIVFMPYMVGGLIPGVLAASAAYYLSEPVIRAYQNRRKGMLKAKLQELARKATNVDDPPGPQ